MADNNLKVVIESLLNGMDGFASSKTVVGDPIQVKDTIILPLMDVSFAVGAGAGLNEDKKKNSGGGGMGAKMTPSSVLVIQDGSTRLINIKNQDTVTKVLDMVPDLINRFTGKNKLEPEVQEVVDDIKEGNLE